MHSDFTNLKQTLQDPADGPYALDRMRGLLVQVLKNDWPSEAYTVADLLLPWSGKISDRSRGQIAWLIEQLEGDPKFGRSGLASVVALMQTIS